MEEAKTRQRAGALMAVLEYLPYSLADNKAASPMAGIVTVGAKALSLLFAGVYSIFVTVFLGGWEPVS